MKWNYMRFLFFNWTDKDEADCDKYGDIARKVLVATLMILAGLFLMLIVSVK